MAPVGVSWRRLVRATHKIHYFLVLPGGASAGCRGPPLSGGHPLITSSGAPLIALPLGEGGEHGNARSHGEGTDVSSSQNGLCVYETRCAVPFGTTHDTSTTARGRALTHQRETASALQQQRCCSAAVCAKHPEYALWRRLAPFCDDLVLCCIVLPRFGAHSLEHELIL